MSCGYEGIHFGSYYPDAACIDGLLWDLDSCDEPGNPMIHGGNIPCPKCHPREYIDYFRDQGLTGNAKQRRQQRRAILRKVLL